MTNRVELYDTTLRDGTQQEGISLSVEDKLAITKRLDQLGIDVIEGGYAGANPKDDEYFERVQSLNLEHAQVAAFGNTRRANGDVGKDPIPIVKESVRITKKLKNVKILWASTREAYNYLQAKNCGCSIITMPSTIIDKISKFGKSYQELTLDTVRKFLEDSKKSNFKI